MAHQQSFGSASGGGNQIFASVEDLLLAALARGGTNSSETGRYLVTFKESAAATGLRSLQAQGLRVADARDFPDQAAVADNNLDAEALLFPEIGVLLLGEQAAQEREINVFTNTEADSPIAAIEAEHFVFPAQLYHEAVPNGAPHGLADNSGEYLRGFLQAAEIISQDLLHLGDNRSELSVTEEALVLGVTWGLNACKVPASAPSGFGIKVATLDTGMDLRHPDFVGRHIVGQTFVGQPVQDLHGHALHCIGTACGPKAPVGTTPRYGIGHRSSIFAGKVLTNSGSGTVAGVLAGLNWAIANRCPVILLALASPGGVQAAYTAAGQAALNNGCLIVAAAGSAGGPVGFPANSPTIMSVGALDKSLSPTPFSNRGKIDIAAPGVDIFSAAPMPRRYATMSGTSMAAAHVAGCAALWAETMPNLRGLTLWRKLQATAKRLPFPASQVGAGLVQAP